MSDLHKMVVVYHTRVVLTQFQNQPVDKVYQTYFTARPISSDVYSWLKSLVVSDSERPYLDEALKQTYRFGAPLPRFQRSPLGYTREPWPAEDSHGELGYVSVEPVFMLDNSVPEPELLNQE